MAVKKISLSQSEFRSLLKGEKSLPGKSGDQCRPGDLFIIEETGLTGKTGAVLEGVLSHIDSALHFAVIRPVRIPKIIPAKETI